MAPVQGRWDGRIHVFESVSQSRLLVSAPQETVQEGVLVLPPPMLTVRIKTIETPRSCSRVFWALQSK